MAVNRGQNSSYQVDDPRYPLKMFYGDFNGDGNLTIIESYYEQSLGGYVPKEPLYRFGSHGGVFNSVSSNREFAGSTLQEMLNRDLNELVFKRKNTLQHMIFINKQGKEFEFRPLPAEAQLATAFNVTVADMDNDGNEDLFLSQNFFAVTLPQQTPRKDAGRGLWLRGDGQGRF